MKKGCTAIPTSRSEAARLHKKTVDGERSEGVLKMAAITREFPVLDMSINGALRTQFIMIMA